MTEDIVQGSDEWVKIRLGKVTGSRIHDVMARTPSGKGWGATRDAYMAELICERLTGERYEKFKSKSMERGNEVEEEAAAAYAFRYDANPIKVGFVYHPRIAMAGCSPDRLLGEDGLMEIKTPDTHTHIKALMGGNINGTYLKQIGWQFSCTNRKWCDFVSFDPRLPENMSLHVERIYRDDAMIYEMESAVIAFLTELDAKLAALLAKFGEPPVPHNDPMFAKVMA